MKKIKYISLIACVSLYFLSYEKKLDQIPLTSKTSDNFYSSEVEAAVNAVYASLQFSGNYASMLVIGTISGEDMYEETTGNDGGVYQ